MIYILQFARPVGGRANYYIGYAQNETTYFRRMKDHSKGRGAKLTAAALAQGISWKCIVIVPQATRADERRWKNWHNAAEVVRALTNKGYGPWL